MTLQECKDLVAKQKNFIDWSDLCARDHYTNIEHSTDKAAELYAQQIVEEATRWIPVSERLPEKAGLVIVYSDISGVAWFQGFAFYHLSDITHRYINITHWQPLPKAPTV